MLTHCCGHTACPTVQYFTQNFSWPHHTSAPWAAAPGCCNVKVWLGTQMQRCAVTTRAPRPPASCRVHIACAAAGQQVLRGAACQKLFCALIERHSLQEHTTDTETDTFMQQYPSTPLATSQQTVIPFCNRTLARPTRLMCTTPTLLHAGTQDASYVYCLPCSVRLAHHRHQHTLWKPAQVCCVQQIN